MSIRRVFFVPALLLGAVVSCSDDDDSPVDPDGLAFPSIPQQLRNSYCIRGNVTVGDTPTGTISSADCDDFLSYTELWLVKVDALRNVTFTVTSGFDSQLWLYRITSITSSAINISPVADDDDSAGDLNAELAADLDPDEDYLIVVGGKDHFEQGSYTLAIHQPTTAPLSATTRRAPGT
jgi:hypothetical protein